MPHGQKTKTKNRNNIVTNSIKTLKMVHIKKKKKTLKKKRSQCHRWWRRDPTQEHGQCQLSVPLCPTIIRWVQEGGERQSSSQGEQPVRTLRGIGDMSGVPSGHRVTRLERHASKSQMTSLGESTSPSQSVPFPATPCSLQMDRNLPEGREKFQVFSFYNHHIIVSQCPPHPCFNRCHAFLLPC